ncbi:MAG: alpha/beta hydrolase-fold protein [Bacteroidota bacterium]
MRVFFALCLLGYVSLQAQLTIIVDSWPASTPSQDNLHVAGDFQAWDASSQSHILTYLDELDRYEIHLPDQSGSIQFKFTRGSWETVEGDAQGNYLSNRLHNTSGGDTLFLQIAGWEDLDSNPSDQSTAAQNVTIIATDFPMTALDRVRRIWLYLPPDYATSGRDYPVLYMQDGQNVFDAATSFSGEWEVDETLNTLFAQGDPGAIVVAVDNGGSERLAEYTPWPNPTYGGGDGNDYIDFLVNDLKPYIDANYRTKTEQENTAILGSSLGGLISTYAALSRPDVFGKVGALSPAYWINRQELADYVADISSPTPLRLHQLIGIPEGETFVQDMLDMESQLLQVGYPDEEILSIQHLDGAHSEWYWAREFADVYQWLFPNEPNGLDILDPSDLDYRQSPNPAQNQLIVRFHLDESSTGRLLLYDARGESHSLVSEQHFSTGQQELIIDLQKMNLPSAQYWVHLQLGNRLLVQPLIIR